MFVKIDENNLNQTEKLLADDLISILVSFLNDYDQILVDLTRSSAESNSLFYTCLDQSFLKKSSNLSKLIDFKSINGIRKESELFTSGLFPQSIGLSFSEEKNAIVVDGHNPSMEFILNKGDYSSSIILFSNHWRNLLIHEVNHHPNKLFLFRPESVQNIFDYITIRCFKKDPLNPKSLKIKSRMP